nr:M90 family metallopeptidase [Niveibacterium umoris]
MLIITLAALVFASWMFFEPQRVAWRRRAVLRAPCPDAWRDILRRRVPYFRRLPADLQLRLKERIKVFIAEKAFVGCAGLEIDDEIRVTIAAQACLLILNHGDDYCYPKLQRVLVYPGAFAVTKKTTDPFGLQREQRQVLAGESWSLGQVVLSWQDTLDGAAIDDDGRNVVFHEFAHQLDQETGAANGTPELPVSRMYAGWAQVLGAEFEQLRARAAEGETSLLDDYGATNPGEFFAVASEVFFERPREMAALHPGLYQQLSAYYRLDPRLW